MAARKDLAKYPPQFQDATMRVIALINAHRVPEDGVFLRITMGSEGRGVNLMLQLRQYWNALHAAYKAGEIKEYEPRYAAARDCSMLACRAMKSDKRVIEIMSRSAMAGGKEIEQAFGQIQEQLSKLEHPAPSGPHLGHDGIAQESLLADTYKL